MQQFIVTLIIITAFTYLLGKYSGISFFKSGCRLFASSNRAIPRPKTGLSINKPSGCGSCQACPIGQAKGSAPAS